MLSIRYTRRNVVFALITVSGLAGHPLKTTHAADSLESIVARTMIIGFDGDHIEHPDFQELLDLLARIPVGGVIYMGRNIRSDADVVAMNRAIRETSQEPVFISVDEEGGAVRRLRRLRSVPATPSARDIGRTRPEISLGTYTALAQALAELGFDLNYGPVVDLAFNAENPVITRHGRAYSSDPNVVVEHAAQFVAAHHSQRVASVAKHFPGHGSVSLDPHDEPVDATISWQEEELRPFHLLIQQNPPAMVMTSHQIIAREPFCAEHPITFCPDAMRYLRSELRFGGPIISDDLTMGAIITRYGLGDAVIRAVTAGHDAVILANPGPQPIRMIGMVIREVSAGLRDNIESVMRFADAGERLLTHKRSF